MYDEDSLSLFLLAFSERSFSKFNFVFFFFLFCFARFLKERKTVKKHLCEDTNQRTRIINSNQKNKNTSAEMNVLRRDHRTGLRMLTGEHMYDMLPRAVSFQLQLCPQLQAHTEQRHHHSPSLPPAAPDGQIETEEQYQLRLQQHRQIEAQREQQQRESVVDLEIFFCDPNCGVLGGDAKPSRVVILTARHLAVYTHNGVLKHKMAFEDMKRIEFVVTNDDSAASVLIIPKATTTTTGTADATGDNNSAKQPPVLLLPLLFTFMRPQPRQLHNRAFLDGMSAAAGGEDGERSATTNSSGGGGGGGGGGQPQPLVLDDMASSPTTRVADFRAAIGCLCRLRNEAATEQRRTEVQLKVAQHQTLEQQYERQQFQSQAPARGGDDAASGGQKVEQPAPLTDEDTHIAPTNICAVVVVAVDNSLRLDICLRSLATPSIELASSGNEPAVPPLEVPLVPTEEAAHAELQLQAQRFQQLQALNPSQNSNNQAGLAYLDPEQLRAVETVERLLRREKDMCFEDARDAANEALLGPFSTTAIFQGTQAAVDGLHRWIAAREALQQAQRNHHAVRSNLQSSLAELEAQHKRKEGMIIQLANEAQVLADRHMATIEATRSQVADIDARISDMENLLQQATDVFTGAMREKDSEIAVARQAVDRMRFELTKGTYARLPSMKELVEECEKLEYALHSTSARAELLHISAPDKSVLLHLTAQLDAENRQLQEDILDTKKQRRATAQNLIKFRMELSNGEARAAAARSKLAQLSRRRQHCERHGQRLTDALVQGERTVASLQQKVHRLELEAVVVEDLKREELMHRSITQSLRQEMKADFLERRKVERLMREESKAAAGDEQQQQQRQQIDRRSRSREIPQFKSEDAM